MTENCGFWGPFCRKVSEELGVTILDVMTIGSRHMAAGEAILTPDDLKGRVLRVPPGEAWPHMAKAFGAIPSSIEIGGVEAALREGSVYAVENPLSGMKNYKIDQIATDISLTGHVADCLLIVQSNQTKLTQEQQNIVRGVIKSASIWHDIQVNSAEEQLLKTYRASEIHAVHAVDQTPFREAVNRYYIENNIYTLEEQGWVNAVQQMT